MLLLNNQVGASHSATRHTVLIWELRLCRSPAREVSICEHGACNIPTPAGLVDLCPSSFPAAAAVTTISAWGPVTNLFLQRHSASPLDGLQSPGRM